MNRSLLAFARALIAERWPALELYKRGGPTRRVAATMLWAARREARRG